MTKKCILILLDGLGDRSYQELNYQTPLQAAKTLFLDQLALKGSNGLYHPALQGQALPSENAHFIMFGYDMGEFPGRGVFEALGAGIKLTNGHVAVLAHLAGLKEEQGTLVLDTAKPEAPEEVLVELVSAVQENDPGPLNVCFTHMGGIYGIVTLQGHVLPYFTDSDPFISGRPLMDVVPWKDYSEEKGSQNGAAAIKDFLLESYGRLRNHPVNRDRMEQGLVPVNGLVTQRAGRMNSVESFRQRYGLRGLSIASGRLYSGLAAYLGMDFNQMADSGDAGKDIYDRLVTARRLMKDYDFIHVHTKTPDEASHTKDPLAKKRVIEALDRGIGKAIKGFKDDPETLIIVTADHSTPSSGPLIHSGETVPITFFGEGVRRDYVNQYDEISVASGALGIVRGKELMYLILNYLDRAKLHGIMDMPVDQPFWPGEYNPLSIQ